MSACLGRVCLLTMAISIASRPAHAGSTTSLNPDCTITSLIAALNIANTNDHADTITLPAGCVYTFTASASTSPQNNGPNALPVVLNDVAGLDLTIDGNGATLARWPGAPNFRLLGTDTDVTLTINDLNFRHGKTSSEGGAIHGLERSSLTVHNSVFEDNIALGSGDGHGGGAIFIKLSRLQMENSNFNRNSAGNGGAIKNLLNDLAISATPFTNNTSTLAKGTTNGGGALIIDGANRTITLRDTTFRNNTSHYQGGGLMSYLYSTDTATIERSTIRRQPVHSAAERPRTVLGLRRRRLAGRRTYTIDSSTFSTNTAQRSGGGMFLQGAGVVMLRNSTVAGNQALNPLNTTDGLGGGIFTSNIRMTIINSTIASNLAGWTGGGFWVAQPRISLKNSIVANNTALNGGNPWNIKHNCGTAASYPGPVTSYIVDDGNNIEWP